MYQLNRREGNPGGCLESRMGYKFRTKNKEFLVKHFTMAIPMYCKDNVIFMIKFYIHQWQAQKIFEI